MQTTREINEREQSRFRRRLARLAESGALVRLVDAQLERAKRDFAKATLARRLAPKSAEAKQGQIRAYLALCEAMKRAEVAS